MSFKPKTDKLAPVMEVPAGMDYQGDRINSAVPMYARPGYKPHGTIPQNQTDRGVYDHGVDPVAPTADKDAAGRHLIEGVSDNVSMVLPETDTTDKAVPVPVRIVEEQNRQKRIVVIEQYTITGTMPVRIVGYDSMRTSLSIGTVGTVTGNPRLLADANPLPVAPGSGISLYGWPIPPSTGPLRLETDDELWVVGTADADTFVVAVLVERRVRLDPYDKD